MMEVIVFFFTNIWHFLGLVVVLYVIHDLIIVARQKR